MLLACADSTQPNPESAQPAITSFCGPKRSTSQPCSGDSQVCSTIRIEMVTWMAARLPPVAVWNGFTNRVQTYCGLEIAIMATSPRVSWIQRCWPDVGMGRPLRYRAPEPGAGETARKPRAAARAARHQHDTKAVAPPLVWAESN